MSQHNNKTKSDFDTDLQTAEPSLYNVIIHNDDYTPMDFVVMLLKSIFKLSETEAEKIMLDVHNKGAGVAGTYSFEIAETKAQQCNQLSKQNKYPLKSSLEEV